MESDDEGSLHESPGSYPEGGEADRELGEWVGGRDLRGRKGDGRKLGAR